MDPNEQLDFIKRAAKDQRELTQETIEGHLAASSVVVSQLAAMQTAGLLQRPDFQRSGEA